jgi:NADPH-dependent 2,4-dienoyl-CoA reductase/sulfur reductase-like enzyme
MEQFISPHTNKRTDEYGGSFENRMRVPVTFGQGIHKKLGDDFPVGFKMSAWEEVNGGIDFPLAQEIAKRMTKENLVYVHVATMSSTIFALTDYPSVPPMYCPRNTLMPLADNVRKAVPGTPLIATGAILNPADAEEIIASGRADMVAVGRAMIADAEWANRAKEGKRYRPCIRCNWCHDELFSGREVRCSVNPYILHEAREPLTPADKKKKVMVVGGGPGGIMAALTASKRGHSVTLYEKESELGGMLIPGTKPVFKKDVGDFLDYLRQEIADSAVTVKTGVAVTPDFIEKEAPDAVVIAMGGRIVMPQIPGVDKKHVYDAIDVLKNVSKVKGGRVAVIGGGDVGCETAAHLAQNGKSVTVIEMLPELMEDEIINVKIVLEKIMRELGIKVLLGSKVEAITDDTVIVMGRTGQREVEADAVVLAMGIKEQDGDMKLLEAKCDDVYIVGDCAKQGRIRDAVRDGEMAGRLI